MTMTKAKKEKEEQEIHPYGEILSSFKGKIVEVKDISGNTLKGECLAIYKLHLNIILKIKDEIIIIKNPNSIKMKIDKYGRAKEK